MTATPRRAGLRSGHARKIFAPAAPYLPLRFQMFSWRWWYDFFSSGQAYRCEAAGDVFGFCAYKAKIAVEVIATWEVAKWVTIEI